MATSWSASQPLARGLVGRLGRSLYSWAHRLAAVIMLVLLSPLLVVVAVMVRLDSSGPALFRQTRVGLARHPFVMLKFRTMRADCEDSEHRRYVTDMLNGDVRHGGQAGVYKLVDERVTRLGAFLRRTSIDELPQLVNVVRGDMMLVGPRPALAWEAELFPAWAHPRFAVRPGLTGLWQVSGRNGLDYLAALRLDVAYVTTRSVLLDLKILLLTVSVLFGRSVTR
ncbi:MAG: hypothetical protein QOJ90_377 [Actinomycetota bacterium]|jgi:lipopolysaccharide/colanic/teichoic acid biosynthesis glycosyltransferase|nr:hypothetical protein [Actinomycetota bacterium]MDQ1641026.1 hypothetical protein [Actinomycetota bacterium]